MDEIRVESTGYRTYTILIGNIIIGLIIWKSIRNSSSISEGYTLIRQLEGKVINSPDVYPTIDSCLTQLRNP